MVRATRERLLRWSGCAALGIVTFAAGVQLAFPYPRLEEKLVAALADYEVAIDHRSRGWWPGRFALHGVRVTTRRADRISLAFDRIDIDVAIGPLLAGRIELAIDARGPSGAIDGRIDQQDGGVALDLVMSDLPPRLLGGSLRMAGHPALRVSAFLPGGRLAEGRGAIDLTCDDCAIESPHVSLGPVAGRLSVTRGVACLAELRAASGDGELELGGGVRFAEDLAGTSASFVARVRIGARIADPDVAAALSAAPRTPDGRAVFAAHGRAGEQVWTAATSAAARPDCTSIGAPLLAAARPAPAIAPMVPATPPAARVIDPQPASPPDAGPPPIPFEPELTPPLPAPPQEPVRELEIEY